MNRPWREYSYWEGNICTCGSGKETSVCKDAQGDYVASFCDDCEDYRLSGYSPDIWKRGYRYEELEW
tara:strand:- start:3689 stop:3889 length:201 start_codon:yes stop_codon:yes gene_type:complete